MFQRRKKPPDSPPKHRCMKFKHKKHSRKRHNSPPKKTRKDGFGAMKGKYDFPPDFDEWFVAADKEILEMFSDDPYCEFQEAVR